MIYAVTSPEKFEGDKGTKLMQVGIHFFPFTNNFKVFYVFIFSCTFSFLYAHSLYCYFVPLVDKCNLLLTSCSLRTAL